MTASVACAYLHDKVVMVELYSQNHPNMSAFISQPSSEQCNITPMKLSTTQTAQPVIEVKITSMANKYFITFKMKA
jgi:hypothetical protein